MLNLYGRAFYMQKKQKPKLLRITVYAALLSALSIVFGKYLAFNVGEYLRFSFENLPIIFAGLAFGPIIGAVVGTVADLLGCLLVGYEINPLVTVGAAVIGLAAGFCRIPFAKSIYLSPLLPIVIAELFAHIIGSVVIKTVGLAVYYDMPIFLLMAWRLLNYLVIGAVEGALIYALFKNPAIKSQISSIRSGR
jgi:ECF transporter S component (folate family)